MIVTCEKCEKKYRVDPEKIKADYKDGILKIDIPKAEENKPRQVTIH